MYAFVAQRREYTGPARNFRFLWSPKAPVFVDLTDIDSLDIVELMASENAHPEINPAIIITRNRRCWKHVVVWQVGRAFIG
ncbi:MAG: hypothetical protein C9356_00655 [Oleiphilus sp.]|nr:MAG: hypothetical protein C9356_00655 [Oleiphilus sp.]